MVFDPMDQEYLLPVKQYWDQGANCAQATCVGILEEFDYLDEGDLFNHALIPFGGGFGEGLICGAISGSLAAFSFIAAQYGKSSDEIKTLSSKFKTAFRLQYSFLDCMSLKAPFQIRLEQDLEEQERTKINEERRNACTHFVYFASNFIKDLIESMKVDN